MSSSSFTRAIKGLWEKKDNETQIQSLPGYNIQGQIDDVFLVLALMGESLLPLEFFDETHFESTLKEVKFAFSNAGHVVVEDVFDKMSTELKYLCVAALTVCAVFSPLPVYRGFGASVHSDWDWACPDFDYLEAKAKKSTSMFVKTPDPQPNRPVLLAFDRAIQLLQNRSMAFLSRRPAIASLAEQQPNYSPRSRNEVASHLHTCRDWKRWVHKNGHPAPSGMTMTMWSMPWAGYTSPFSCEMTRDFEQILTRQMDPGRLLYAYLCHNMLHLSAGHLVALPPGSPAEVLAVWLADRPGMQFQIVEWDQMNPPKEGRLRVLDKKVSRKSGRYPLPNRFAVRNPNASSLPRAPPKYTSSLPTTTDTDIKAPIQSPVQHSSVVDTAVELGEREAVELDSSASMTSRTSLPPQAPDTQPVTQSSFVTGPDEMPLNLASLERDLPAKSTKQDEPELHTVTNIIDTTQGVDSMMYDTSAIPSPLRLRNPRTFVAELPGEPFEASVSRSATVDSTISSTTGPWSSFSPVSPLTSVLAENMKYIAMPANGPSAEPEHLDVNSPIVIDQQAACNPVSEGDFSEYLSYGRAASG